MKKPRVTLDVEALWEKYQELQSVHKVGRFFGVTGDTVHQWLIKAGKILNNASWKMAEIAALHDEYKNVHGVNIDDIAAKIGRSKASVACKAEELGLTARRGKHIRREENKPVRSAAAKRAIKANGHPRGMLGKKHTQATKDVISEKGMGRSPSAETVMKTMKTKVMKYGRVGNQTGRGSWRAGWREIGGQKIYARSRWEANYARFLEFLKERGEIANWEHEPETFWFEAIKRGCRSYLPDFRVTQKTGEIEYHEVKGWMDSRSKTKIKRMKKYHPSVKLILIQAKWFNDAERKKLSAVIPGWEPKTHKPGCMIRISEMQEVES